MSLQNHSERSSTKSTPGPMLDHLDMGGSVEPASWRVCNRGLYVL